MSGGGKNLNKSNESNLILSFFEKKFNSNFSIKVINSSSQSNSYIIKNRSKCFFVKYIKSKEIYSSCLEKEVFLSDNLNKLDTIYPKVIFYENKLNLICYDFLDFKEIKDVFIKNNSFFTPNIKENLNYVKSMAKVLGLFHSLKKTNLKEIDLNSFLTKPERSFLNKNLSKEDLVFSHGDLSLGNIGIKNNDLFFFDASYNSYINKNNGISYYYYDLAQLIISFELIIPLKNYLSYNFLNSKKLSKELIKSYSKSSNRVVNLEILNIFKLIHYRAYLNFKKKEKSLYSRLWVIIISIKIFFLNRFNKHGKYII